MLSPKLHLKSFQCFFPLSQKMVSTLPLKNWQINEKCNLQTLRTFIYDLKIALKQFSKNLPIIKFWYKKFLVLFLAFPENVSNFVTQKSQKKKKKKKKMKERKISFSKVHNIRFWVFEVKVASKPFSKLLPMTKFGFGFCDSKMCKKVKNVTLNRSEYWFLTSS